jgi:hypothetical protein
MRKQAEYWLNAANDDLILINEIMENEYRRTHQSLA